MNLAGHIKNFQVAKDRVALIYLGQAGFCIKTGGNRTIIIDAYLSDACERLFNFKRMIPKILSPEEVEADLYLSTHAHVDHLDYDALPIVAGNNRTFFLGSSDCEEYYKKESIPINRYFVLKNGRQWSNDWITVRAVYADHGDLAPDAVGLLLDISGIKIYHTGDTSFAPGQIKASLASDIDILLAPINGQYGNMTAAEAIKLAEILKPKLVIATHFWMFVEHVSENGQGDPAAFLKNAAHLPHTISARVMAPGELFIYPE